MSGHAIDRGHLVEVAVRDDSARVLLRDANGVETPHFAAAAVGAAIIADGLIGGPVELVLAGAGETSPAGDERRRYLAELDRATRLERALADAEQALAAERRENAHLARRASECLRVLCDLSTWADAAHRGELDVDEPTASDIADATLREWAVDVYAALCVAHRAHGGYLGCDEKVIRNLRRGDAALSAAVLLRLPPKLRNAVLRRLDESGPTASGGTLEAHGCDVQRDAAALIGVIAIALSDGRITEDELRDLIAPALSRVDASGAALRARGSQPPADVVPMRAGGAR